MRYLVITSFILSMAVPLIASAQHVHEAHANEKTKLQLNHGKKWRTDAPLRAGMAGMRAVAIDTISRAHEGKATDAGFDASAQKVNKELGNIVQKCRLAPAADAQLHVVIGKIMAANEAMEGKVKGKARADGAVALAEALNLYGEHFEDPAWQPINTGH